LSRQMAGWWYGPDVFGRIPNGMHRWKVGEHERVTPACGVRNDYGEAVMISSGMLISEDERPDIERCQACVERSQDDLQKNQ